MIHLMTGHWRSCVGSIGDSGGEGQECHNQLQGGVLETLASWFLQYQVNNYNSSSTTLQNNIIIIVNLK